LSIFKLSQLSLTLDKLTAGDSGPISHSVCKLITALGEHSTQYLAGHLNEPQVQAFMKVALGYTGFPGWYGMDEEESEVGLLFALRLYSNLR
jgi:hypothetical protein